MTESKQTFPFEDMKRFILDEIEPAKSQRNKYICPICGSGTGKNRTAAFTVNPDFAAHCYACGFHGDIFDLYAKRDRISDEEARQRVMEKYGNAQQQPRRIERRTQQPEQPREQAQDFTAYIEASAAAFKGSPAETYLAGRGITAETAAAYRIGYDQSKNAVVIPYPQENYYITRSIEGKAYRKPTGTTEPLFNAAALQADRVFITEGQLDALSIIQAGGAACAIGGGGVHKLDGAEIKGKVYIFADNDEAGGRTANNIRETLKQNGVRSWIIRAEDGSKDANELLQKDAEALRQIVASPDRNEEQERREYAEQAAGLFASALFDSTRGKTSCVSTGFAGLDNALGGGIYEGLYVIGAVSSLGKTTLALQIGDQIAQGGTDVLFFSLEMQREELIAKSLSRLSFELSKGNPSNAKTTRGITDPQRQARYNDQEWELMFKAFDTYQKYGSRIWIDEGMGTIGTAQIEARIQEHIEKTGRKPIVFIDYLQILQSVDIHMTDKQATDRNVFNLKRISRDYKTPIVAISSLNRENYTAYMSMAAFKESGAIEYSSDVLIGVQPQGMKEGSDKQTVEDNRRKMNECKAASTREVELVILKNRHGAANAVTPLSYNPMFNSFREQQ